MLSAIKAYLARINRWFTEVSRIREGSFYLAEAKDHADLERRLKELERRGYWV